MGISQQQHILLEESSKQKIPAIDEIVLTTLPVIPTPADFSLSIIFKSTF
jgi:hypothetical protein